jgi:hypothetical protein
MCRVQIQIQLCLPVQYVPIFMKLPLLLICYNVPVLFHSPLHDLVLISYCYCNVFVCYKGAHSCAISCGTALQARRSRVQFPKVSLRFFIDIILPTALQTWGKGGQCIRLTNLHVPTVLKLGASASWNPQALSKPNKMALNYI